MGTFIIIKKKNNRRVCVLRASLHMIVLSRAKKKREKNIINNISHIIKKLNPHAALFLL